MCSSSNLSPSRSLAREDAGGRRASEASEGVGWPNPIIPNSYGNCDKGDDTATPERTCLEEIVNYGEQLCRMPMTLRRCIVQKSLLLAQGDPGEHTGLENARGKNEDAHLGPPNPDFCINHEHRSRHKQSLAESSPRPAVNKPCVAHTWVGERSHVGWSSGQSNKT